MSSPAIVVDRVSKYYDLAPTASGVASPSAGTRFDPARGFAALRDVSFTVPAGTATALIGKNGAGKSTMLRVLAGITSPTDGTVALSGTVATLLSLRAGLNPRLSGRENLFLYAALLGFDRGHMDQRLAEIVEFAELGDFVDMPLGSYSPGMSARLAFSAAIHLDADILLIDEILAVGDASFQKRAAERMQRYFDGGHNVVFSSHNLAAVHELCSHVIWFDEGRVRLQGPADEVLERYRRFCHVDAVDRRPREDQRTPQQPHDPIATFDHEGARRRRFAVGETLVIEYAYDELPSSHGEIVRLSIHDPTIGKIVYRLDSRRDRRGAPPDTSGKLRCVLEELRLPPRQYWIEVTLHGAAGQRSADFDEEGELLARSVVILFDPEEAKTRSTPIVSNGYMEFTAGLPVELHPSRFSA